MCESVCMCVCFSAIPRVARGHVPHFFGAMFTHFSSYEKKKKKPTSTKQREAKDHERMSLVRCRQKG